MAQLLSMGKELEDQARKVYEMSEAFAQKYEQQLETQSNQEVSTYFINKKITNQRSQA
jgi:hypothetical protein